MVERRPVSESDSPCPDDPCRHVEDVGAGVGRRRPQITRLRTAPQRPDGDGDTCQHSREEPPETVEHGGQSS